MSCLKAVGAAGPSNVGEMSQMVVHRVLSFGGMRSMPAEVIRDLRQQSCAGSKIGLRPIFFHFSPKGANHAPQANESRPLIIIIVIIVIIIIIHI